jgi:hypothetical protein
MASCLCKSTDKTQCFSVLCHWEWSNSEQCGGPRRLLMEFLSRFSAALVILAWETEWETSKAQKYLSLSMVWPVKFAPIWVLFLSFPFIFWIFEVKIESFSHFLQICLWLRFFESVFVRWGCFLRSCFSSFQEEFRGRWRKIKVHCMTSSYTNSTKIF